MDGRREGGPQPRVTRDQVSSSDYPRLGVAPLTPAGRRATRAGLTRCLVHAFDALRLREALVPTRATPGLWAGLDAYGLTQAPAPPSLS